MKKILSDVVRRANILAVIMIALFGMTMVSCSDDDDEHETPKATGPQLEKVY